MNPPKDAEKPGLYSRSLVDQAKETETPGVSSRSLMDQVTSGTSIQTIQVGCMSRVHQRSLQYTRQALQFASSKTAAFFGLSDVTPRTELYKEPKSTAVSVGIGRVQPTGPMIGLGLSDMRGDTPARSDDRTKKLDELLDEAEEFQRYLQYKTGATGRRDEAEDFLSNLEREPGDRRFSS